MARSPGQGSAPAARPHQAASDGAVVFMYWKVLICKNNTSNEPGSCAVIAVIVNIDIVIVCKPWLPRSAAFVFSTNLLCSGLLFVLPLLLLFYIVASSHVPGPGPESGPGPGLLLPRCRPLPPTFAHFRPVSPSFRQMQTESHATPSPRWQPLVALGLFQDTGLAVYVPVVAVVVRIVIVLLFRFVLFH